MKKKSLKSSKYLVTILMTAAMLFGTIPVPCDAAATEFVWLGKNGLAKVNTGLGNGTGTEGLWFVANDKADGGKSEVILDHADPNDHGNNVSDEDVKKFGGVSGTVKLDQGTLDYSPYVVIGFNIVGLKDGKPVAGDVSGWGGLSIYYECDSPATLQLDLDYAGNSKIGYANHEVALSKTDGECVVKSFAWSDFKQPAWANADQYITVEEAVARLASVKFKIQGKTGDVFHFKITGIGSKNVNLVPDDFNITYNLNGGTNATGNPATYNASMETFTLANPVRSGYEFAGWFNDAAFQTAATTTIAQGSTGDKTFYAKWKKSLTNADITVGSIADQVYTGSPVKPAVVLKDGTKTLLENIDYSVTYRQGGKTIAEPVEVGTYDVVIEGKGDYFGTLTRTFKIIKNAPATSTDTSEGTKIVDTKKGTFELTKDPDTDTYTAALCAVADKNKTEVVIGDTIKYNGETFKITQVKKGAFKGSKTKKVTIGKNVVSLLPKSFQGSKVNVLIVKTKHLTAKSVKNAFKGSKAKSITVYVKVGSKKENRKYVSLYKKIFTKKNVGKKVAVK